MTSFPFLDPGFALRLGVNEQREARGLGDDDTILNGQLVIGQTL